MLALSRSDLRTAVPMRDAVELMKGAFRELSAGRAFAPVRAIVQIGDPQSMLLSMPGYVPSADAAGIKIVSFFAGNGGTSIPVIHALVYMIDAETGVPLGIMEGGYVTALRTGAVSGAATDLLARPESSTLTVIGTGVQGVTQAAAVCSVRPITRIIGVDGRPEARERFIAAIKSDWPEITAVIETTDNADAAVAAADVVCCATTARQPVFSAQALRKGTHLNAIGAFTPEMQEVPPAAIARATVVVDNIEACREEAGDLIKATAEGAITTAHWTRELGQIVAGDAPARISSEEITFF
ncbi:MAG TPA: ornithine cyclodeaminase, partial [Thermomicrobiales bacterium]|nr:ornithine cyclodeaminase [Thermomicrobiales bacterium]